MEPNIQSLIEQGFEKLTDWIWLDGKIRLASLDWPEASGWLYAFVVDGAAVKYVGLTERVLRSRMDNYRDNSGDQNQRLRELIAAELKRGREVAIYGRREPEPERLTAEEERLRREFVPPWNRS